MLGVAYLHKAGMDSGIFRQADDMCLLPSRPGRAYAKTADVENAIAQFTNRKRGDARRRARCSRAVKRTRGEALGRHDPIGSGRAAGADRDMKGLLHRTEQAVAIEKAPARDQPFAPFEPGGNFGKGFDDSSVDGVRS